MANPFLENYPDTCLSCGFLGIIDRHTYGNPVAELQAGRRANGNISADQTIWCFLRKAHLETEINRVELRIWQENKAGTVLDSVADLPPGRQGRPAAIQEILQNNRDQCVRQGAWFEWIEYFSPKEHYEMRLMMELEKLRQQQAGDHLEITKTLATINTQQMEMQRRAERSTARFNVFFGILALLTFLLALAPLAYPNGFQWAVNNFPGGVEQQHISTPTPDAQRTP